MTGGGRATDPLGDLTAKMSKMKGPSKGSSFIIEGEPPGDGREQLAALAALANAPDLHRLCQSFSSPIPWQLDLPGWTTELERVGQSNDLRHLVQAFGFITCALETQLKNKQDELSRTTIQLQEVRSLLVSGDMGNQLSAKDQELQRANIQLEELRSLLRGGA